MKGGAPNNEPLGAVIANTLARSLSIDWRWIATERNIADWCTRNKWKGYKGRCPILKAVQREMRQIPWDIVVKRTKYESEKVRTNVTFQGKNECQDLISLLKASLSA
jgi:hypothetical protein